MTAAEAKRLTDLRQEKMKEESIRDIEIVVENALRDIKGNINIGLYSMIYTDIRPTDSRFEPVMNKLKELGYKISKELNDSLSVYCVTISWS